MKLKIFTPKRCQKIRKHSISMLVAIGTIMSMTVPAFAAVSAGAFVSKATTVLRTVVVLIGAGLGIYGLIHLFEGYSSDNAAARSQGMKQLMGGIGIIICGVGLVPVLGDMMNGALS